MSVVDSASENSPSAASASPGDIDVVMLLTRLWQRKLLLVAMIGVAIAAAALFLSVSQYKYTAELTVMPADQNSPKIPSSVSNLGSLVGVDLGAQSGSSFTIFPDTARSFPVAEILARDQLLMRTIFPEQWDARTGQWRQPDSAISRLSGSIKTLLGAPYQPWRQPGPVELRAYIQEFVVVAEDKKKSMLTFSYMHRDPAFAAAFLQKLVNTSDDYLRAKSLQRSTTYVRYLERRLNEVQIAEYRNLLAQTLVSYENKRMMASSEASFAADQFGDVWVSAKPTSPLPLVVIGIAIAAAIVLWLVYVLIFETIRLSLRARGDAALDTVAPSR